MRMGSCTKIYIELVVDVPEDTIEILQEKTFDVDECSDNVKSTGNLLIMTLHIIRSAKDMEMLKQEVHKHFL